MTFTASYSDSGGANDLQVVYLSFGSSFLASHTARLPRWGRTGRGV